MEEKIMKEVHTMAMYIWSVPSRRWSAKTLKSYVAGWHREIMPLSHDWISIRTEYIKFSQPFIRFRLRCAPNLIPHVTLMRADSCRISIKFKFLHWCASQFSPVNCAVITLLRMSSLCSISVVYAANDIPRKLKTEHLHILKCYEIGHGRVK